MIGRQGHYRSPVEHKSLGQSFTCGSGFSNMTVLMCWSSIAVDVLENNVLP